MYNKFISKKAKKLISAVLVSALVMTAIPTFAAEAATTTNALSTTKKTLAVGQKYTLTVKNKTKGAKVTYKMSNKTKVATVSSKGKITAKKKGTAYVVVTVKKGKKVYASKKCKVTVITGAKSVSINQKAFTLYVNQTKKLTVTMKNKGHGDQVTWSSSKKAVATVSTAGKVTAQKAGTATITAKAISGKKATVKVVVKNKSVTPTPKVTTKPTETPTGNPVEPTQTPTGSSVEPTEVPTGSTLVPTEVPTGSPLVPTEVPTGSPLVPTEVPTGSTVEPTLVPTKTPIETPLVPTEAPTESPLVPTEVPTESPEVPTVEPTVTPVEPTSEPIVPLGTVTVNVQDGADHQVLTGASITVKSVSGGVLATTTSAVSGNVFALVNGDYVLVVEKMGYITATAAAIVADDDTEKNITLNKITPSAIVGISIKDASGAPVSGASISYIAGDVCVNFETIKESENRTWKKLPNNDYIIAVHKPGYQIATAAAVLEGEDKEVEVRLQPETGATKAKVKMKVVNDDVVSPSVVTGAYIYVISVKEEDMLAMLQTNQNGDIISIGGCVSVAENTITLTNGLYVFATGKTGYKQCDHAVLVNGEDQEIIIRLQK